MGYHDRVCGSNTDHRAAELADPLRLTAYHEAGHAVMAQLCGQHVTEVEIIGDEEHAGTVQSRRLSEEQPSECDPSIPTAPIERRLLCVAAGMVAEAVAGGKSSWDESSEELDEVVRLAMRVVGDCERVIPFLEVVREHTEDILRQDWPAVEALADELMERRRMTGEEVRRLLTPLLPQ